MVAFLRPQSTFSFAKFVAVTLHELLLSLQRSFKLKPVDHKRLSRMAMKAATLKCDQWARFKILATANNSKKVNIGLQFSLVKTNQPRDFLKRLWSVLESRDGSSQNIRYQKVVKFTYNTKKNKRMRLLQLFCNIHDEISLYEFIVITYVLSEQLLSILIPEVWDQAKPCFNVCSTFRYDFHLATKFVA